MTERRILGGTDGFRGEFNNGNNPGEMNPPTVYALSQSLAEVALRESSSDVIVVGYDTRLCNRHLLPATMAGLEAGGAKPLLLGISPTPTTLRTAQTEGSAGAISLTASHNPSTDGGWKGTIGPDKPYGAQVTELSDRAWEILDSGVRNRSESTHPYRRQGEFIDTYIADVVEVITDEFGEQPLRDKLFVVDGARGAGREVTPRVLRALGARVEPFACDNLGSINKGCGATDLRGAQKFALDHNLHYDPDFVGIIANDGDADRVIGAFPYRDSAGSPQFDTIDGNRLLELMARGERGVVGTVYTNDASVERIRAHGAGFAFCDNGDVEVTRKLRENNWRIGSEFSGHHVDLSWLSSGDGILKGAWLAAYATRHGINFRDIAETLPLKPQILHNFKLPAGIVLDKNDERLLELGHTSDRDSENSARSIARPSGTEPLFRLCVQAETEDYVRQKLHEGLAVIAMVAETQDIKISETRIA